MRITVDALPLLGDTGVTVYVSSLLRSIAAKSPADRYTLSFRSRSGGLSAAAAAMPGAAVSRLPIPNRLLEAMWTGRDFGLPLARALFGSPDVYFATMYFSPSLPRCRVVSTVYDVTPLKIPEYSRERASFLRLAGTAVRRSARLLAISESAKRDFCSELGADPARVTVTPLAPRPFFRPPENRGEALRSLAEIGVAPPYILYVGNLGPHKNVSALVRAFAALKRRGSLPHKLVLCGKPRWGEKVLETVRAEGAGDHTVVTGYQPEKLLPALYGCADLFAYISLYEGFGLPVLEAMACGAPALISPFAALPEVAGGAALQADPRDLAALESAIERAVSDRQLNDRLRSAGLARAASFTWERTAELTLSAFREAAA